MGIELVEYAHQLGRRVAGLRFAAPVAYVYNPLAYAWGGHRTYLEQFGQGPKRVVFMGMNPGPWGMAQTGVPFGEVAHVKDWMGIDVEIGHPDKEHPKRPIQGMDCPRSEVSGRRLWGYFAQRFGTAKAFFEHHFVMNYCPLAFMSETGANITPDKLPAAESKALFDACNDHLREVVECLQPEWVIGVGAFAEARIQSVVAASQQVGRILHPSPASPAANRDWAGAAGRQLVEQGVWAQNQAPVEAAP